MLNYDPEEMHLIFFNYRHLLLRKFGVVVHNLGCCFARLSNLMTSVCLLAPSFWWLMCCRSHWHWRQTAGWGSRDHQCIDQCWDSGLGADRWQTRDCHQCCIFCQIVFTTDGVAETVSPIERCSSEDNRVFSAWYWTRISSRYWVRLQHRILLLENIITYTSKAFLARMHCREP